MMGVRRVGDSGKVHCQEFATGILCLSFRRETICFLLQKLRSPLITTAASCLLCQGSGAPRRGHQLGNCVSLCLPCISGLLIVLPSFPPPSFPPSLRLSFSLSVPISLLLLPLTLPVVSPSPSLLSQALSHASHFAFCELFHRSIHLPTPSFSPKAQHGTKSSLLPCPTMP